MNTTVATSTAATPAVTVPSKTIWSSGAVAGVAGSAAALATHLVAKAADVPMSVDGKDFPLFAFPQVTLMSTLVGIVIALVATRRSARPRHTFVVVTLVLTALAVFPPLMLDTDAATKVTLEIAHAVAAAVVIPVVARRLPSGQRSGRGTLVDEVGARGAVDR